MTASRFARVLFAAAIGAGSVQVGAQQPKPATSTTPRSAAAIDLTGYWVSYVTEDWRFRMITPPKGDYRAVPLTAEGRKTADAWDPAADARTGNECRAYGAAPIMRGPARLHISWQDDNTLRVEAGVHAYQFPFSIWVQKGYGSDLAQYYKKVSSWGIEVQLGSY